MGAHIDQHSRQALIGVLMYLTAALLFAFNGTIAKAAMDVGLEPTRLTELRNAGALVTLVIVVAIWKPSSFRVQRSEWPFLIAYGVLAFAIIQFLYFFTISRLPIGIGTLLTFLAPVLVALWIRFGTKQAVSSRIWIAVALTLFGLALVAQIGLGVADLDNIGVLSGLLAAVALALYWILGEAGQRRRDPISLTMWGFFFATLVWSVVAPWWSFPWAVLTERTEPIAGGLPALPVWAIMLWNVVPGTVIPFLLVLGSLRRIGAQRAGLAATTEPLWAFLIAFMLLGETITGVQMIGALIVMTGIVIAETSRRSKSVDEGEFLPTHS